MAVYDTGMGSLLYRCISGHDALVNIMFTSQTDARVEKLLLLNYNTCVTFHDGFFTLAQAMFVFSWLAPSEIEPTVIGTWALQCAFRTKLIFMRCHETGIVSDCTKTIYY